MTIRHQPPALSPLSPTVLARALPDVLHRDDGIVAALAQRLALRYSADHVRLWASGTQALQAAIAHALSRAGGRMVALPAFGCFDLATAAIGANAGIQLYDVAPETLAPEPASLEKTLERGARVAVIAPFCGVPVDWSALETMARRYDALLIEDAAQGHGASWRGQVLGSMGRISVLSFGRGKGWTGGAGGAMLLRDETPGPAPVADSPLSASVRAFIAAAAQWALARPALYGIPAALPFLHLGETVYHAPSTLHRMPHASASLVLAGEAIADEQAAHRRRAAADQIRLLPSGVRPILAAPGDVAGYLRLPVHAPGVPLARRVDRGAHRLGIAAAYPTTLADLPVVSQHLPAGERAFPGAEQIIREMITLPVHDRIEAIDRTNITRWLEATLLDREPDPR